jgi:hypothetical protein
MKSSRSPGGEIPVVAGVIPRYGIMRASGIPGEFRWYRAISVLLETAGLFIFSKR